jgi:antitoxin VapB
MTIAQIKISSGQMTITLPEGFEIEGTQVSVRRRGNTLILEPIADNWQWLDGVAGQLDQEVLDSAQAANSQDQFSETIQPDLDSI